MPGTDPGTAREEAERLVATLLAAARVADIGRWARRYGGVGQETPRTAPSQPPQGTRSEGGLATGAAECCICPVCRGITALRDPSPEFAERLATGAGELAAGVVHLLRAFAEATTAPSAPSAPTGGPPVDDPAGGDQVWREATRTGHDSWPAPESDVWAAATHADAGIDGGGATPPADGE